MIVRRFFYIASVFFCILFPSCLGVYYDDLGKKYALIESREIVKITGQTDNALYHDVIIRPEVLNFAHDDRYIIVYQVYSSWTRDYFGIKSETDSALLTSKLRNCVFVDVPLEDSLAVLYKKIKEIKDCYWIIDKETDEVMGPMRKEEFDRKCKALNVKAKMNKFFEKESRDKKQVQLPFPFGWLWNAIRNSL